MTKLSSCINSGASAQDAATPPHTTAVVMFFGGSPRTLDSGAWREVYNRPAPSAQRPAPSAQRPAPSAQRPAPSAQRPAPSAQRPAPRCGVSAPRVRRSNGTRPDTRPSSAARRAAAVQQSPPASIAWRRRLSNCRPSRPSRVARAPRSLRSLAAAGLLLAGLLLTPVAAQAQTEIWSATLSVKALGAGLFGCQNTNAPTPGECSNASVLIDDDFTLGNTTYNVTTLTSTAAGLSFIVDNTLTQEAQQLSLVVDGTSFAFEDADRKTDTWRLWSSGSPPQWADGDSVSLSLILIVPVHGGPAPPLPAAPTLISNVGQYGRGSSSVTRWDHAQYFHTGDDTGYQVTSVDVRYGAVGATVPSHTVSIWTATDSNTPGSLLATLRRPAAIGQGVNRYTGTVNLDADTGYFLVLDATSNAGTLEVSDHRTAWSCGQLGDDYNDPGDDSQSGNDFHCFRDDPGGAAGFRIGNDHHFRDWNSSGGWVTHRPGCITNTCGGSFPILMRVNGEVRSATQMSTSSLSVHDAGANEANGSIGFRVTLDPAADVTVTVDYATADGTAEAGSDYTETTGSLTFEPGETAKTVEVPLIDDDVEDGGETFTLTLRNAGGATIDDAEATGTILNTEPHLLTARFEDVPASHNGSDRFTFNVAFSHDITINIAQFRNYALDVTYGTVKRARRVDGQKDLWEVTVEPDFETYELGFYDDVTIVLRANRSCDANGGICTSDGKKLSNRVEAIVPMESRDDTLPALSVADAEATEGEDNALDFVVTLDPAADGQVTVDYATADGTATGGADYTDTSGTLTFDAGETRKTVAVPIAEDTEEEGGETVTLTLSNASGRHARRGVRHRNDPERGSREHAGDGGAGHQRDGAGGQDADGVGVGHLRRRRAGQCELRLSVDPRKQRHSGRDRLQLHAGERRRRRADQGPRQLYR